MDLEGTSTATRPGLAFLRRRMGRLHARYGEALLWIATVSGLVPSHAFRRTVYRRLGVKFADTSVIYWRCRFFGPEGVTIGQNSIVGNDAFLDGRGGLAIGSNVNIGAEVRIYTRDHDISSPDFEGVSAPVQIDDWAYLGSRVTILPGVHIGEGAVVASGCVMTKDAQPWTVYGGVPGKPIGARPRVSYTLDTSARLWFQ